MIGRSLGLHIPIASYTATLSAAGGGASLGAGTLNTKWERWGDSIYVIGRLTLAADTNLGSGAVRISLPNSYQIDGSKLVTGGVLFGSAFVFDSGAHANDCEVMVLGANGESFVTFQPMRVGTAGVITATNPITWATSDALNFGFVAPIIGL